MKKLIFIIIAILGLAILPSYRVGAREYDAVAEVAEPLWYDSVNEYKFDASHVFVNLPTQTLDLLSHYARMDLLDYYAADSIAEVPNSMEGLSHLIRPVTDDYLKVQITPISTLTVKILPFDKKEIAVTAYTVGDSLQASDTDLRFYDESMVELDLSKFIKPLTTEDFFNFKGVDSKTRSEILDLVPFPTVEYTFEPGEMILHGRLTSGEFLGKETLEKISPYMQRDRCYKWNGKKFTLLK